MTCRTLTGWATMVAVGLGVFAAPAWSAAAPAPAAKAAPASASPAPAAGECVWKHYTVQSPTTGKIERFWVGHAKALKAGGKYPVLYLLPGLLDTENNWKSALEKHLGRYEVIAVCPSVGGGTWFMNAPAQPWMRWGDFLTEDLRTFVETQYPAAHEKGQRGIVGISAGGHGAFYHAITRPDLYGSVSVLSGAMDLRAYAGAAGLEYWVGPRVADAARLYADRSCLVLAARQEGPLPFSLFLDSGDKDGALPQMASLLRVLDSKGIKPRWFVGQGTHSWTYWAARAEEHLKWHAEEFARNRSESRYPEAAPLKGAAFEIIAAPPEIDLSEAALQRLRAPWTDTAGPPVTLKGLPAEGAPLSQKDEKYREATLEATLPVSGHEPGVHAVRLTLGAASPLPKAGSMSLRVRLRNGRHQFVLATPPVDLDVPAGAADRKVTLRMRLLIELKPPDPLRGGLILAVQAFDATGKPAGDPIVHKAGPGTAAVEKWVPAPEAMVDFVLSLSGKDALPLAAVHEARLEAEP